MDRNLIKRRLIEQNNPLQKELIKREEIQKYKKYLDLDQIKAIIGPRRAGKTTLGFQLLEDKKFYYVNFDDEILSLIKQEELGVLLEILNELFGKRDYIFLDEVQNVFGWELFVNRLQRLGYNILITGSNSKLLSKELSTHLGGRVISLELLPFSFKDFLKIKKISLFETDENIGLIKNALVEYLNKGSFPEVLLNLDDKEIIKKYYDELYTTVIFRDIAQRFKLRNINELNSITTIIINQFGTRLSLTKISKQIGLSVHTINKYLSYLDEAYFTINTKKFSYKPREMELSFKKYYLIDSGFINLKFLNKLDFGRLMENLVAIELKRRSKEFFYYFFDNYEIDFLSDKLIQVVFDETEIPERELKHSLKAAEKLKKDILIITWNLEKEIKLKDINVKYLPLWKFLLYDN